MFKKIVWTIIFLAPVAIVGILKILGFEEENINTVFNSSNAISGNINFFKNLFQINSNSSGSDILNVILLGVIAFFWTIPLWYAWKGTFPIGWIPLGFLLRIIVFGILLIVPGIIGSKWPDSNTAGLIVYWMGIILISLALVGLWLKS